MLQFWIKARELQRQITDLKKAHEEQSHLYFFTRVSGSDTPTGKEPYVDPNDFKNREGKLL